VCDKSLPNSRGEGRQRCIRLGLLAAALVVFATTQSRAGSLQIVVENTAAAPGSVGQFDVILQNDSASAVTIGAFSVDVLLSSTMSVSFTGINNNTTLPYIFSITGSFPPGFAGSLLPMEASGNDVAASGGQVVNPGQSFGLADVTYLVDPSASAGSVGVTLEPTPVFLPPPGGTSLSDDQGNPVAFASVNGTITIQTAAVVPEPSTAILLSTSGLILLLGRRFSRRG
jgi:hypothetical protein